MLSEHKKNIGKLCRGNNPINLIHISAETLNCKRLPNVIGSCKDNLVTYKFFITTNQIRGRIAGYFQSQEITQPIIQNQIHNIKISKLNSPSRLFTENLAKKTDERLFLLFYSHI